MTAALKLVEPGIYRRGQIDYDAIDAVNFSTLKGLRKSPRHYRHLCDHRGEITTPMRLGDAAHTATLEPVRFTRDYAVYVPPAEAKTDKRGTNAWKEFADANPGKNLLKQGEFDAAMRIRDAVRSDVRAMRYLRKGDAEQILIWRDRETGVLCKARADFLSASVADVLVELKSAADVTPERFQAAYARYDYHVQAAWYCDGYEAVTGRAPYHKCIAVESKEPHDVVVYDVIGDPIEHGREAYREYLTRLVACREKDEWPGLGEEGEVSLRLPAWATPDDSDDLNDLGLELE